MSDQAQELLSSLQERLAQLQLGAGQLPGASEDGGRPAKLLDEMNLDGVAKLIKKIEASDNKQKIVVMTGAGISTAAGIPDFRSPDTGLYANLQNYNLPNPQAIFDISYFHRNPRPFFHLARELYPGNFKPTLSHYFIHLLEKKGVLLRSFTQNIDTLERRAGVHPDMLVEAHGHFQTAHCITCKKEYSQEYIKEQVFSRVLPKCREEGCYQEPSDDGEVPYRGIVKPDIVFFGEALPERFLRCAMEDTKKCELLLILGTSLLVQPFASLTDRVLDSCPRVLINLEKAGEGHPLLKMMGLGGGMDFSEETGYRDVFIQSTCDEGCRLLAGKLGWEDELMQLFHEEHAKLDKEMVEEKQRMEKLAGGGGGGEGERGKGGGGEGERGLAGKKAVKEEESTKPRKEEEGKGETATVSQEDVKQKQEEDEGGVARQHDTAGGGGEGGENNKL